MRSGDKLELGSQSLWNMIKTYFSLWKHERHIRKRKKEVLKFIGPDTLEVMSKFFKSGEKLEIHPERLEEMKKNQ